MWWYIQETEILVRFRSSESPLKFRCTKISFCHVIPNFNYFYPKRYHLITSNFWHFYILVQKSVRECKDNYRRDGSKSHRSHRKFEPFIFILFSLRNNEKKNKDSKIISYKNWSPQRRDRFPKHIDCDLKLGLWSCYFQFRVPKLQFP